MKDSDLVTYLLVSVLSVTVAKKKTLVTSMRLKTRKYRAPSVALANYSSCCLSVFFRISAFHERLLL